MQGVSEVSGVKGSHVLNHDTGCKYGGIFHFNVAIQRVVSVYLLLSYFLSFWNLYLIERHKNIF